MEFYFTREQRHSWKYCFWCSFGEMKFDLNTEKVKYPLSLHATLLTFYQMDRVKRIWYLSPMRAAKVQASLRIRAVSPEPLLLAHTSSESRGTFRQSWGGLFTMFTTHKSIHKKCQVCSHLEWLPCLRWIHFSEITVSPPKHILNFK